MDRRRYLTLTGLAGVGAVAGCVDNGDEETDDEATNDEATDDEETDPESGGETDTADGEEDSDDTEDADYGNGDTDEEADEESGDDEDEEGADDEDEEDADEEDKTALADYLEDANNYDGEFVDLTGEEEVTVTVMDGHANGFDPAPSFDPVAIEIEEGTTVIWEWEDEGHSVTHEPLGDQEELFDTGVLEAGDQFEYTFGEAGEYLYSCTPHLAQGHLGGVRVVEE